MNVLPQRLTEQQAADELGVSLSFLRQERKSGKIGYVAIGRRIYYLPEQIAGYFNERKYDPCQITPASPVTSVDTGLNRSRAGSPASGTGHGMIDQSDKTAVSQLARETFKRRKGRSSHGCSKTSDQEMPPVTL